MPEQSLIACTSPKASPVSMAIYKQFGDGICHPPCTATVTSHVIKMMCAKSPPTDLINFLKVAKEHWLNGVFELFWRDWFYSDPSRFLLLEVLHHLHRFSFDHNLQWCIAVVGSKELDYHFTLTQTPIGYRPFDEGVSNLKQVTGCDHHAIQHYIIGIVAGAVPPQFPMVICGLLDFRYLAQMPSFTESALSKLDAALQLFHNNKEAIMSAGVCSHFEIPILELLQHVVPSIWASGAVLQWSADITEHAHITEIKKPACTGNNQSYYSQIARHLDRTEKCARFDVATCILSLHEGVSDTNEEDQDHQHEPDEEMDIDSYHSSPTRKVINYFNIASSLSNGEVPDSPKPLRTFTSSTTAINLAVKPSLRMSIDDASEHFQLPDLHSAICEYFYHSARGEVHKVSGHRPATACCNVPATGLQIWSKFQVQQRTFHNSGTVDPPQMLIISPPHNTMQVEPTTLSFHGKDFIIKDCWTHQGRKVTEEQVLQKLKEHGINGLPILKEAWTVQIDGQDDTTDLCHSPFLKSSDNYRAMCETRVHHHYLLQPLGSPITEFSCLQEFLSIFIDIVHVHECLVNKCRILHHDVSLNNALKYTCFIPWHAITEDKKKHKCIIAD
ncbi:hypothetical protein SCLCIDRAFT_29796 [Scleroderma citrinum Foug A]|uniref:Fungal-type protein kinase domain-containing protein n=1 Tax=Scleroderma citrinum Foug A TaxID=1036808 RepID=A0A0C2Z2S7_9AGAM|nr:hypothetical protein SCLCIDRAFT_29796 [Scleroderma citrinum Foug A]